MANSDERNDSLIPKFYAVEIDGIETAKFRSCEGLEIETYIYEVEEGGLNTTTHKFVGRTRYPNLILEHGVTDGNELYEWYENTVLTENEIERKDGSIVMYNSGGDEIKRWNFFRALPCRWIGPKVGPNVEGIAVEKIEITHEGLELG